MKAKQIPVRSNELLARAGHTISMIDGINVDIGLFGSEAVVFETDNRADLFQQSRHGEMTSKREYKKQGETAKPRM